jgi:pSer/pThr/pTyr-binding forkhead associated (FHA) protein
VPNLTVKDSGNDFIHQVEGEVASIGRAPTNAISIHDAKASKEHCRIERVGNRWKMIDLESKNGTRVNGDYCNKAWLNHGDVIQIGKAEIRFGVEGASRRSGAPVSAPSRPARPQQRPQDDDDYYDDEEEAPPPPRRYGKSTNDKLVTAGLLFVGAVVVFIIASKIAATLERDDYNLGLIERAEQMKSEDQWREALAYLQEHGEPSGSAYYLVQQRMKEIESRMDDFYKQRDEDAAKLVPPKLSRKCKDYNARKQRTQAEDIVKLVDTIKRKYPNTEAAQMAKKKYPAWFAGKVPQRASDLLRSGGRLLKDWQEAEDRSYEYVKEWKFREARETIEVFLTAREAILDASDVEYYKKKVDEALRRIDMRADSIFNARRKIAWDHEKKKRYKEAIAVYREIILKFGIDHYVRKAQDEINKIESKHGKG